jgi:hypothetical protein
LDFNLFVAFTRALGHEYDCTTVDDEEFPRSQGERRHEKDHWAIRSDRATTGKIIG